MNNKEQVVDICFDCIKHVLQIYINCHGVNTLCNFCHGRGQVKDFYYNNDYNWEKCTICNGTGKLIKVN